MQENLGSFAQHCRPSCYELVIHVTPFKVCGAALDSRARETTGSGEKAVGELCVDRLFPVLQFSLVTPRRRQWNAEARDVLYNYKAIN